MEGYATAGELGHVEAQFNLARCYYNGHGVTQDFKQAVEWFLKATEQGDADAQFQLGQICVKGRRGVKPDRSKAVEWLTKAAKQGHVGAQTLALGLITLRD